MLLDSARRSVDFLQWAVAELRAIGPGKVVTARAEEAGRDDRYRGSFAAVVARSFGPPAVTAECAAPLLRGRGSIGGVRAPSGRGRGNSGCPGHASSNSMASRWLRRARSRARAHVARSRSGLPFCGRRVPVLSGIRAGRESRRSGPCLPEGTSQRRRPRIASWECQPSASSSCARSSPQPGPT